jgi:predicted permease
LRFQITPEENPSAVAESMGRIYHQLRQVSRRLFRAPFFSTMILLTLALGIGANTIVFSVVEGVMLKPLPYREPQQLIGILHAAPGIGMNDMSIAPYLYFTYRDQATALQDIGVYSGDSVNVTGAGEPEHVRGLDVSSGALPLLGVTPMLGRLFTREDDTAGSPDTVMLSYSYWRRKFSGDRSAVGRTITVDGKSRLIIGVLPKDFQFLDRQDPALVLPYQWDRGKTKLGNFSYNAFARLKPGATMAQASADLARLIPIANRSYPAPEGFSASIFDSAGLKPNLKPLKQIVIGDVGNVLWVLMGSIALVLLIACANVANLLLVRLEGRRQELAIQAALGAGWRRIAGDLLCESLILSLLGSVLGLGMAYGGLKGLIALAPAGIPRLHEIGIDFKVLLFTLAIALLTSLLIGMVPIFKFAGTRLSTGLRAGGRAQSQGREQHRARSVLVVLQVGLAVLLLICSGLMIRTFNAMVHVSPGFNAPGSLQTFRIYIPETSVPDKQGERLMRMEEEIGDKLAAIPGVTAVAFSTSIPMDGNSSIDPVMAQDRVYKETEIPPLRRFKFISPGFFASLGSPMVAGRDLTWDETYHKVPVAIISENFAKEYWHDARSALGQHIRVGTTDDWREIIGVAGDMHDDGVNKPAPTSVYWPALMDRFEGQPERVQRYIAFSMRSQRAGSQALMKEIQQAVWSVDSNLPLADAHTLEYYYTRSMARTSFTLVMLCIAGGMALILGIVGIYGVISYSVSQSTREIGIRLALGAQRQAITAMFVRHGLGLAGIGIGCGLAAAFATMRLMSSLLFNVSPVDPATYAAITVVIVAITYLACYFPSRRAAAVEPVTALRAE